LSSRLYESEFSRAAQNRRSDYDPFAASLKGP
jgi:hypothetical protein